MSKFLSKTAIVIIAAYAVLRINDPLEIYDTAVNFVQEMSIYVTVVEKIWGFIVSPVIFVRDHFADSFLGDLFSGKGLLPIIIKWIFEKAGGA